MSLKYAVLGFLTFEPLSGYDLKTRYFDGSVANFWPTDQKQIYRALDTLEQEGWASSELQIQEGRPNRREFTITPAGRNALRNWARESRDLDVIRFPFLVQLYFSRVLPADEVITLLEDQIAHHRAQLAFYDDIDLPALDAPDLDYLSAFGSLTLDFGRRFEHMHIEWLQNAIVVIRRVADQSNS